RWPAVPAVGKGLYCGSRPSTRAIGAAQSLPLPNRGAGWTPRHATLLCSASYRCSAQSPLGRGTETCLAWSFLRSVWSRLSAQPIGSPAEMNQLILKCANASRASGEWKDKDYDVIADGVVVGRIFTHVRARVMGSYISTRKCLRTNMEFVSMTTVVRCPSTGRACSEPTCQERHWCRKM